MGPNTNNILENYFCEGSLWNLLFNLRKWKKKLTFILDLPCLSIYKALVLLYSLSYPLFELVSLYPIFSIISFSFSSINSSTFSFSKDLYIYLQLVSTSILNPTLQKNLTCRTFDMNGEWWHTERFFLKNRFSCCML